MNARSLLNKATALEAVFRTYEPEEVVVTETWLDEQVTNDEVFPAGYKIFRKDRYSRGGGVAIAVKDSISCTVVSGTFDAEMIWLKQLFFQRWQSL